MPLSNSDLTRVELEASQLILKCKIKKCPIPVKDIAKELGLDVVPYDLGEGVSGALIIKMGKGFIGYSPSDSKVRQRFTIAHELGHYVLHNNLKSEQLFVDKDFIVKYRSENSYTPLELKHEQEANAFAAGLLMPRDLVLVELQKKTMLKLSEYKVINALARIFDVSVPAMTFRLTNMNATF